MISVFIPGKPAPQGSKTYLGKGRFKESCEALQSWRHDIRQALISQDIFQGPVSVTLEFVMPRPAGTPKKRTPPAVKRPDLDKLCRAVFDAMTSAGIIVDDSYIVALMAGKRIAEIGETAGLLLTIQESPTEPA